MKKVVSLAAVFCLSSMPVLAGGFSPEIVEEPVAVPVVPVAGGSVGNTGVVAGVAGVVLLAALLSSSSSSTTTTTN